MEWELDLHVNKYLYSHGTQGGLNTSPYFRPEDETEPNPIEPHFMCINNDGNEYLLVNNYRIKDEVLS